MDELQLLAAACARCRLGECGIDYIVFYRRPDLAQQVATACDDLGCHLSQAHDRARELTRVLANDLSSCPKHRSRM